MAEDSQPSSDTPAPTSNIAQAATPSPENTPKAEAVEAIRKLNEQRPQTAFGIQMALGMPSNPIHEKITEQHISKSLEIAASSQSNEFWMFITERAIEVIALVLIFGAGFTILFLFKNNSQILVPTLSAFGGFAAGGVGGYGMGSRGRKRE